MTPIKQNDTRNLDYTLMQSDGITAHDLTGASVVFNLARDKGNGTPSSVKTVNRGSVTIVTATSGEVRYALTASNTSIPGDYLAEFEVTFSGGNIVTFPENGYIRYRIIKDIA